MIRRVCDPLGHQMLRVGLFTYEASTSLTSFQMLMYLFNRLPVSPALTALSHLTRLSGIRVV